LGHLPKINSSRNIPLGLSLIGIFYIVISVTGVLTIYRAAMGQQIYFSIWPGISAIFAMMVIILFDRSQIGKARSPLSTWIIARTQKIGILTYCIYVWHEPIFLSLRSNLPSHLTLAETFSHLPLVAGLTALFAIASYWMIERPAEKMRV
jgi:peptidoglycan/LPS O-acetylase OafA/YrhL